MHNKAKKSFGLPVIQAFGTMKNYKLYTREANSHSIIMFILSNLKYNFSIHYRINIYTNTKARGQTRHLALHIEECVMSD